MQLPHKLKGCDCGRGARFLLLPDGMLFSFTGFSHSSLELALQGLEAVQRLLRRGPQSRVLLQALSNQLA